MDKKIFCVTDYTSEKRKKAYTCFVDKMMELCPPCYQSFKNTLELAFNSADFDEHVMDIVAYCPDTLSIDFLKNFYIYLTLQLKILERPDINIKLINLTTKERIYLHHENK